MVAMEIKIPRASLCKQKNDTCVAIQIKVPRGKVNYFFMSIYKIEFFFYINFPIDLMKFLISAS